MSRTRRNLSDVEKFCLDAWSVNADSVTAFRLSHPQSKCTDTASLIKMARRWLARPEVTAYLDTRRMASMSEARTLTLALVQ